MKWLAVRFPAVKPSPSLLDWKTSQVATRASCVSEKEKKGKSKVLVHAGSRDSELTSNYRRQWTGLMSVWVQRVKCHGLSFWLTFFTNCLCQVARGKFHWGKGRPHFTHETESPSPLHYKLSTLIGGKGGAGPSSIYTTLEGPMEYVSARYM